MSVTHGSFTIERTYPASPARVFFACSDPEARTQWFGVPGDPSHTVDFRVGGREYSSGSHEGMEFVFDAVFQDIVPEQRIISTYWMTMNGQRISVSLAAMEFTGVPGGTTVTYVEHGAYLDGLDTSEQRETGTREIFDALGRWLAEH